MRAARAAASPPARRELAAVWAGAGVLAAVLSALKISQHFSLQTQAYDLGVYANVLWNTGHGRLFQNTISDVNYLGDHFAPLLIVLVPLLALWKNAAVLLVFQSAALAAALPAVYFLSRRRDPSRLVPIFFCALFALSPYFHHISRYDFHEAAFGVPLLLWWIYAWRSGREKLFWALSGTLAFLREDFSLILAAAAAWFALTGGKGRRLPREQLWLLSAASLAWFLAQIKFVLPAFGASWRPAAINYGGLGGTPWQAARALMNPVVLWANTLGNPEKALSLARLLASVGGLCLFSPGGWPLWLAPAVLQLASGLAWQYRFENHYSAAVLPFLIDGAVQGWAWLSSPEAASRRRWGLWLGAVLAAGALGFNVSRLKPYVYPLPAEKRAAFRKIMDMVPAEDSVQAGFNLVPQFAFRESVRIALEPRPTRWVVLDRDPVGFYSRGDEDQIRWFYDHNRGNLVLDEGGFWVFHFPGNP